MQVNGEIIISSQAQASSQVKSGGSNVHPMVLPNHTESQDPRVRAAAETFAQQAIAGQSDDASSAQIEGGCIARDGNRGTQIGEFGCFGRGDWASPTSPAHVAQDALDRLNRQKKNLQKRAERNAANVESPVSGLSQRATRAIELAVMAADEGIRDSISGTELAMEEVQNIANKKGAAATKNESEKQAKRDAMSQGFVGAVRSGDYANTRGGAAAAIKSLTGSANTGRYAVIKGSRGMNYVIEKQGTRRISHADWATFIAPTAALKSPYQASQYSPSGRGYAGAQSPNNPQSFAGRRLGRNTSTTDRSIVMSRKKGYNLCGATFAGKAISCSGEHMAYYTTSEAAKLGLI